MLHAIGQMLGHVAGVVAECLGGVARLPAADPVLERLRQVPVIQRGERLDAVGEQFVDQTIVEVEPFGLGAPVPSGNTRGQAIENR